jgi:hypothetical protein
MWAVSVVVNWTSPNFSALENLSVSIQVGEKSWFVSNVDVGRRYSIGIIGCKPYTNSKGVSLVVTL